MRSALGVEKGGPPGEGPAGDWGSLRQEQGQREAFLSTQCWPGALPLLAEQVLAARTELHPGWAPGERLEVCPPTGEGLTGRGGGSKLRLMGGPGLLGHWLPLPSRLLVIPLPPSSLHLGPGGFGFGNSFRTRGHQGGSGQLVSWLARICPLSKQELRLSSWNTLGRGGQGQLGCGHCPCPWSAHSPPER